MFYLFIYFLLWMDHKPLNGTRVGIFETKSHVAWADNIEGSRTPYPFL